VLGQHTREVLRGCGYTDSEIDGFRRRWRCRDCQLTHSLANKASFLSTVA